MALVAVVSITALQFLEDGASDELADRSERGAPDLDEGTDGGGTTDSASTDSTDSTDSAPEPTEVLFGGFEDVASKKSGKDKPWSASLQVQVNDATGGGVSGAQVVGRWTYVSNGITEVVDVTCDQTDRQGECKFQLSDIPNNANDVLFEMLDIDGGVPPVQYNGTPQSVIITKPAN